jgi:hypothetical protein
MVPATTDETVNQRTGFRVGSVFGRTCLVFMKFSVVTGVATLPWLLVLPSSKTPIIDLHLPPSALLLIFVFSAVFSIVFSQAIVFLGVFQDLRGRPVSLGSGLRITSCRFFPLSGLALGVGLVLMALEPIAASLFENPGSGNANAWLVFVIAGAGLFIVWFVAIPACVIEELGPFSSLRRSRELTKSHRVMIFVLMLATVAAGMILLLIMRAALGAVVVLGVTTLLGPAISVVIAVAMIWLAVWSAFLDVLLAVTYHDLRMAKEGVFADQIGTIFD